MNGYEALAEAFIAEGTTDIFGIMGDTNQFFISELIKRGVNMYESRHEGPSVAMAEAWAQVTGSVGVCTQTCGPGTAHIATQIIAASRARAQLVTFCGDTERGGVRNNQGMDVPRFAAAVECAFVGVGNEERPYEAVREAFYIARTQSRPVILSAPLDVQESAFEDEEVYTPSSELIPERDMAPDRSDIENAVEILRNSDHVVLIGGRGARSGGAGNLIIRLADHVGGLVATTLLTVNWLRDQTEYHAGISGFYGLKAGLELLQNADCVVAVGSSLNARTTLHGLLYPGAKIIQIDSKRYPSIEDGQSPDCYVQADAKLGLATLLEALVAASPQKKVGYRTPATLDSLKEALYDPFEYTPEYGIFDPREVCRVVDDVIPSRFGIGLGGGHQLHFGIMLLRRPRAFTVVSQDFGAMGKGVMSGIGASLGDGRTPMAIMEGDAGFMMHLAEFETAVRYNVPLLVLVLNDQALGAEFHKAKRKGIDPAPARVPTPDLGSLGVAFGGRGSRPSTMEELRAAIEQFVDDPVPTVIDVRTSTDVVSIPYRRLYLGEEDI